MGESKYLKQRRARMMGKPEEKAAEPKKAPAKKKPIAKRGKKLQAEMRKYKPQMIAFLAKEENQVCQIQMEGCTGQATCVHHAAGRTGGKLHDQTDWIASCAKCNLMVEIDDLEARGKGFKKSRLSNPQNQ